MRSCSAIFWLPFAWFQTSISRSGSAWGWENWKILKPGSVGVWSGAGAPEDVGALDEVAAEILVALNGPEVTSMDEEEDPGAGELEGGRFGLFPRIMREFDGPDDIEELEPEMVRARGGAKGGTTATAADAEGESSPSSSSEDMTWLRFRLCPGRTTAGEAGDASRSSSSGDSGTLTAPPPRVSLDVRCAPFATPSGVLDELQAGRPFSCVWDNVAPFEGSALGLGGPQELVWVKIG